MLLKELNEDEVIFNKRIYVFKIPGLIVSSFYTEAEYEEYICMFCDFKDNAAACKASKCNPLERKDRERGYWQIKAKIVSNENIK